MEGWLNSAVLAMYTGKKTEQSGQEWNGRASSTEKTKGAEVEYNRKREREKKE